MFILKLNCQQGFAYACGSGACTSPKNARHFSGVVEAVQWLFFHRAYLPSIGCQTFELLRAE